MAYVNSSRAASSGIADRLNGMVKSVMTSYARRRTYAATYREINGLTDRELADLGIHRGNIAQIAAEAAYGK